VGTVIIDPQALSENGDEPISHLGWMFFCAMGDEKNKELFEEILKSAGDKRVLDFKLVVNGFEVPLESAIKSWFEQVDFQVEKAAKKLLKERLHELLNGFEDIEERFRRYIKQEFIKAFPNFKDDEDYW
jgi:hypothetical protein